MKHACQEFFIIQDNNFVLQTSNEFQNIIQKFQCFKDFCDNDDNKIIRLMSEISNQNLNKNTFKQILERNINCSNHNLKIINNETNFRLVSSTQFFPINNQTSKEPKKKKNQKSKNDETQPKSEVEKSKQISDSKNSLKQSKVCCVANEEIKIFEEKIKQYTSEMDDSQKIVLNLPPEWIKKFGIQKKKK
ncbi:unnamed protein product [Paramecium sonneborni]|uniref:Uncharacterized protein n=1 Tax=Paramecium sonneborni TaxID=65129 RepID=A0A8S1MCD2_9CILI|nr:unnamed protein product [Paramecium sonneborni]